MAARLLLPGIVLAVLLLAVFIAQRNATATLSGNVRAQALAEQEVARAYESEKLLLDLETGVRGFLLTNDPRFLAPWQSARIEFPLISATLVALEAQSGRAALDLARQIERGGESYIRDFAIPEIRAVAASPRTAEGLPAALRGKARVDALRPQFAALITLSQRPALPAEQRAQAAAGRASDYELAGLIAALALILASSVYLRRGVLEPILRVGKVADEMATGNLSVRAQPAPATELARLASSFNTMADALRDSHDRLRDQAAELRRSEAFLDSVLEHLPNMLVVKDATDLRVVRINHAGEQLIGLPRNELIGTTEHHRVPSDRARARAVADRETIAAGATVDIAEEAIRTRDGAVRYLHTKQIPVLGEHGEPQYLVDTPKTSRTRSAPIRRYARPGIWPSGPTAPRASSCRA